MTMWIMRFVPYAGAVTIDGYFRTEARARDLFATYSKTGPGRVEFTDDYGIRGSCRRSRRGPRCSDRGQRDTSLLGCGSCRDARCREAPSLSIRWGRRNGCLILQLLRRLLHH